MSSAVSDHSRGPFLGALLRLASQVATEQFSQWIASSGFKGIQPAHSAAIQPLWETPEGVRITALAAASRITKQSMSALVSDLESWGYVERVRDPEDARATLVRLTAHGRAYARGARAFAKSLETKWAEQIGSARVEELRAALEMLRTTVLLNDGTLKG